jgi:hypothetical protein
VAQGERPDVEPEVNSFPSSSSSNDKDNVKPDESNGTNSIVRVESNNSNRSPFEQNLVPIASVDRVDLNRPAPVLMKPVGHVPPFYEVRWPNKQLTPYPTVDTLQVRKEPPQHPPNVDPWQPSGSTPIRVKPARGPVSQNKQSAQLETGQRPIDWSTESNSNRPTSNLHDPSDLSRLPVRPSYPVQGTKAVQQQSWPAFTVQNGGQFDEQAWTAHTCSTSICPTPNGYFPHPDDCCSFLICLNCEVHLMRCAPNTQYNPFYRTCTYPYQSQCTARNQGKSRRRIQNRN